MPVSIMLDAGHGGRDPGAVYNGRQEKDDVLKLVLAIGEILQNSGIDVEYTRTTDIYETPFQKAQRQMKPVLISSYRSTGIPVLLPISTWAWKA